MAHTAPCQYVEVLPEAMICVQTGASVPWFSQQLLWEARCLGTRNNPSFDLQPCQEPSPKLSQVCHFLHFWQGELCWCDVPSEAEQELEEAPLGASGKLQHNSACVAPLGPREKSEVYTPEKPSYALPDYHNVMAQQQPHVQRAITPQLWQSAPEKLPGATSARPRESSPCSPLTLCSRPYLHWQSRSCTRGSRRWSGVCPWWLHSTDRRDRHGWGSVACNIFLNRHFFWFAVWLNCAVKSRTI